MSIRGFTALLQLSCRHHPPHAGCLHSLRSRFRFILHRLAIIQGFETLAFDYRMMDHDIAAAAFGRDETETLLVVKPFHLPHRHLRSPFLSLRTRGRNHVAQTFARFARPRPSSSTITLHIAQNKPNHQPSGYFPVLAMPGLAPGYPHIAASLLGRVRTILSARQLTNMRQMVQYPTLWPIRTLTLLFTRACELLMLSEKHHATNRPIRIRLSRNQPISTEFPEPQRLSTPLAHVYRSPLTP